MCEQNGIHRMARERVLQTLRQTRDTGLPLEHLKEQLPDRGLEWNTEARQERGGAEATGQGPSS